MHTICNYSLYNSLYFFYYSYIYKQIYEYIPKDKDYLEKLYFDL